MRSFLHMDDGFERTINSLQTSGGSSRFAKHDAALRYVSSATAFFKRGGGFICRCGSMAHVLARQKMRGEGGEGGVLICRCGSVVDGWPETEKVFGWSACHLTEIL